MDNRTGSITENSGAPSSWEQHPKVTASFTDCKEHTAVPLMRPFLRNISRSRWSRGVPARGRRQWATAWGDRGRDPLTQREHPLVLYSVPSDPCPYPGFGLTDHQMEFCSLYSLSILIIFQFWVHLSCGCYFLHPISNILTPKKGSKWGHISELPCDTRVKILSIFELESWNWSLI